MVKKLNLNLIRNNFKDKGIFVFSPFSLQKYFDVSSNAASLFLSRNVKKKNIVKLKNCFYSFAGDYVNEMFIANKIYEPSYISLEYALSFYNIIPETVYSVTSVTTKATREFAINNISYVYGKIKKSAFTGYVKKDFNGQMTLIAEPEKALADWLYFVSLGKKELNERLNFSALNKRKVMDFAKLYNRPGLIKIIKEIMNKL